MGQICPIVRWAEKCQFDKCCPMLMKFDAQVQFVMYKLKTVKPEVLFHIQDGGRRHLEI